MKVKNKNFVSIMMLAIMLLCGLAATADAAVVVVDGGVAVTIANNATTSKQLVGDITINGTASDMVVGSTIAVICPSGLKFDSNRITIAMGSTITSTSIVVSPYTGTGYSSAGFSNDAKTYRVKVDSIGTGTASLTFKGSGGNDVLTVIPVSIYNETIDSTGLSFQVVTNGNTGSAVTNTVGVVNVLKLPKILSAIASNTQAFTLQFNCSINSSTTKSTALSTGLDITDLPDVYGILLGGLVNETPIRATVAIDGSDATKVNVTLTSGSIYTDASTTVKTGSSGLKFANVLDTATSPTMTSINADADHTANNILPAGSTVTSVTLSKTSVGASTNYYGPFAAGRPILSGTIEDDAFIATVATTASVGYQARLAYYTATTLQPLTPNTLGWQADYTDGGTSKLVDDTNTTHTINGVSNSSGSIDLYFQIGGGIAAGNSAIAANTEKQIVVQASLDNFNTIVQSSPITIDRIIPTVVNITGNKPVATTTSTIQAVFSEEMQKTTVENTSSWT
ncbi:MAG: hypothetical protein NT096_02175, partial [Proteobacteria bacterium]|nr:hypothetical protein [Pseudomonadota bacterium]